jgi:hypothetical protein
MGEVGYGLDIAISHYYGANVVRFFLVMLAYNLMNWLKEGFRAEEGEKDGQMDTRAILLHPWQADKEGEEVGTEPMARSPLAKGVSES